MKKHIANSITLCRMLCSILLLCFPVFSATFYGMYLIGGLSDMVDGTVARKTGSVSEWGARLDTAADILFTAAMLVKVLPVVCLPGWLWVWSAAVAVVKICNIVAGFVRHKRLPSLHTGMNKLTGVVLFLMPLILPWVDARYGCTVACAVATAAALQEMKLLFSGRDLCP